jgi:hypothetical protein
MDLITHGSDHAWIGQRMGGMVTSWDWITDGLYLFGSRCLRISPCGGAELFNHNLLLVGKNAWTG